MSTLTPSSRVAKIMLTAIRVFASLGMLVFIISGTASLIWDAVPSWLVLGSGLATVVGGMIAGAINESLIRRGG